MMNCTDSELFEEDITGYTYDKTTCNQSQQDDQSFPPHPGGSGGLHTVNYWTAIMSSFFVLICAGGLLDNTLVILVILRCTKKRTVTDG